MATSDDSPRTGVIAVIRVKARFLVIRRSRFVRAPRALCFPGGGIEAGESETAALRREVKEELAATAHPICHLWRSVSSTGTPLSWWQAELDSRTPPIANPEEVEAVHWMSLDQLTDQADLLPSNRAFLAELEAGQIWLRDNSA